MAQQITDFSRSFVRWSLLADLSDTRSPGHMPWGNSVRLQIDARCRISEPSGATTDFYLIAPCRKEWMYRDAGLIMDPGAEYRAIFCADRQVDAAMQARLVDDWSLPVTTDGFIGLAFEITTSPAVELTADEEIIDASLSTDPIVVQTTLRNEQSGLTAALEYPVRTMNYHPERGRFQVDTGPLIYPDLDVDAGHPIDRCRLAHTIFNTLTTAEFVSRPEGDGFACTANGVGFRNYGNLHRHDVTHAFWALVSP